MIAYVLDKDIVGEKILKDIQKLVIEFRKDNPNKIPILYMDIKPVAYDDTSLIPKLEHKILDEGCST